MRNINCPDLWLSLVGEKRVIRRFMGYVCQIAKVSVRMSFGWVSLFTQNYIFFYFFVHMRIDIKSDYQFYRFFGFESMCA